MFDLKQSKMKGRRDLGCGLSILALVLLISSAIYFFYDLGLKFMSLAFNDNPNYAEENIKYFDHHVFIAKLVIGTLLACLLISLGLYLSGQEPTLSDEKKIEDD